MFRHIKKLYSTASDRVKSVEFHPTEPILAVALYNGTIQTFNTNNMSILKTIHVETDKPVRCVRFMPSFHWLIAAGDNLKIYCYDYNTGSLVASMPNAHSDFIRQIAVHPTQPLFLSCSDDNKAKLFRINNNKIVLERTYDGHQHFIMDIKLNPKDPSTFATASLDTTIKFWGLTTSPPRFTLSGHKSGVNCIEFFPGSDRPYIASGSDDCTICIWDYQTKSCVVTLAGHSENVTALRFHPIYPLLFSTSEDNKLLVWNTLTHETETALDYQKKRGWTIDIKGNQVAVGYDDGLVMLKIGRDSSAIVTMNQNGKAFWAKNNDIQTANLYGDKSLVYPEDGQIINLAVKDVVTSEIYPSSMQFCPSNNNTMAVCGENEYGVYSTLKWRNKTFGNGREFVWGNQNDVFAVRKNSEKISISFNATSSNVYEFDTPYYCDRIFGGHLLGVSGEDVITFYTWDQPPQIVRQIDVKATGVWWASSGNLVAIATSDALYILQFNDDYASAEDYTPESGSETAFSMFYEADVKVKKGSWFENIFFFNDEQTVSFFAGGHVEVIGHTEKSMTLVGYVPKVERVFLCDNDYNFISYLVPMAILNFVVAATYIAGGDEADIEEYKEDFDVELVPSEWRGKMCVMLEALGMPKDAMLLCDSDDKKFELAMKSKDFDVAVDIARKSKNPAQQYRQLANFAMNNGRLDLLDESLSKSNDESGLLLMRSCRGQKQQMRQSTKAELKNVAFAATFACGDYDKCVSILIEEGRLPEAALMARTYAPHRLDECAKKWRELLEKKGETQTAQTIALPSEYPEKFPQLEIAAQKPQQEDEEVQEEEAVNEVPQTEDINVDDMDLDVDLAEEDEPADAEPEPEPQPQPEVEAPKTTDNTKAQKSTKLEDDPLLDDLLEGDEQGLKGDDNDEVGSDIGAFLDELDDI
ncbi:Coatomer subunit beta'-3 [Tritrichomonas foetus]|uniref:Coatomer subunit beta' n=1 Tax=Tritrichomonas foetus TaxID=1144522 RepID=A0A1J4KJD1_9EUKA|nr:Coatomer subunit beta'-3 [Tritrichomonas foetus]|eukprot:OHT09924.1 Coatomer subunit beta'-3 [Tritrichomonas foetus]